MKPILKHKQETRKRANFRASDAGKLSIDIILELQGVEPTNPPKWYDTLKWGAGKGVELAMVDILRENDIISSNWNQADNETTYIEREGIKIGMAFDALVGKTGGLQVADWLTPEESDIQLNEGEPIEIKSINNKNQFDIYKYQNGQPRENYIMQLAMYMDALEKERGHLFASTIDGLNYFWFVCERVAKSEGLYKCGNVTVDIGKEYKRFSDIWKRKDEEIKDWFSEAGRYKIPVEEIDWASQTKSAIQEARMNRKVIGDPQSWAIMYSPYRDLILKGQGIEHRGYTEEEIQKIISLTKGYSSAKKSNENNNQEQN